MIGQRKGGIFLPAMLVAACLTLAWMVWSVIFGPRDSVEIATVKPAKVKTIEGLAAELKFAMPPIGSYDAILDRPIFSATRRGNSAVIAPTVVVSRQLELKLQGTTITDTDKHALLQPKDGGEPLQLREGEDYQGWTLARVKNSMVVFRRGGAEERLEMDFVEPPAQVSKKKRNRRTTARRDQQQPQRASSRNRNDLRNRNLRNGDPEEEGEEDEDEDEDDENRRD